MGTDRSVPGPYASFIRAVAHFFPDIERNYARVPHNLYLMALSDRNDTKYLTVTSLLRDGVATHSHIADQFVTVDGLRDRGIPVETVIDIGVLHGTPELMGVWPDRQHLLFEPVSEFANSIRNNYRNISHELHAVAVSDEMGTVGLKVLAKIDGMEISHSQMTDSHPLNDPSIRVVKRFHSIVISTIGC